MSLCIHQKLCAGKILTSAGGRARAKILKWTFKNGVERIVLKRLSTGDLFSIRAANIIFISKHLTALRHDLRSVDEKVLDLLTMFEGSDQSVGEVTRDSSNECYIYSAAEILANPT